MTRGDKRCYITFIDDFFRFTELYLLRNKDDAYYVAYKSKVENQLGRKIKRILFDRGDKFVFLNALCGKKINDELTPHYSPESNGVVERKNITLKEMMNTMLISSNDPDNLWGDDILFACHLQNRIPQKITGKTPYE